MTSVTGERAELPAAWHAKEGARNTVTDVCKTPLETRQNIRDFRGFRSDTTMQNHVPVVYSTVLWLHQMWGFGLFWMYSPDILLSGTEENHRRTDSQSSFEAGNPWMWVILITDVSGPYFHHTLFVNLGTVSTGPTYGKINYACEITMLSVWPRPSVWAVLPVSNEIWYLSSY